MTIGMLVVNACMWVYLCLHVQMCFLSLLVCVNPETQRFIGVYREHAINNGVQ